MKFSSVYTISLLFLLNDSCLTHKQILNQVVLIVILYVAPEKFEDMVQAGPTVPLEPHHVYRDLEQQMHYEDTPNEK